MLEHYVEYLFLFPGTIIHVTQIARVSHRDPKKIAIPENCTGFRFFDSAETTTCVAQKQNVSGWYYCNCEKITIDEAPKVFGGTLQHEDLLNYCKHKKIQYIVKTKSRHWIPLRDEDTVL